MQRAIFALFILASLSACDGHTWKETKPLFMEAPKHDTHHSTDHAEKTHSPTPSETKAEH